MSQEELLPCPFCGGEPNGPAHGDTTWWIECPVCEIVTDDASKSALIERWNRRAPSPRLAALERTAEAAERYRTARKSVLAGEKTVSVAEMYEITVEIDTALADLRRVEGAAECRRIEAAGTVERLATVTG